MHPLDQFFPDFLIVDRITEETSNLISQPAPRLALVKKIFQANNKFIDKIIEASLETGLNSNLTEKLCSLIRLQLEINKNYPEIALSEPELKKLLQELFFQGKSNENLNDFAATAAISLMELNVNFASSFEDSIETLLENLAVDRSKTQLKEQLEFSFLYALAIEASHQNPNGENTLELKERYFECIENAKTITSEQKLLEKLNFLMEIGDYGIVLSLLRTNCENPLFKNCDTPHFHEACLIASIAYGHDYNNDQKEFWLLRSITSSKKLLSTGIYLVNFYIQENKPESAIPILMKKDWDLKENSSQILDLLNRIADKILKFDVNRNLSKLLLFTNFVIDKLENLDLENNPTPGAKINNLIMKFENLKIKIEIYQKNTITRRQ